MRACPALLKLTSLNGTSYFPGMACFSANLQASSSALLTESNVSFKCVIMLMGTSILINLSNGLGFSAFRVFRQNNFC